MSRKRKASVKGMGAEIFGTDEEAGAAPRAEAEDELEAEGMAPEAVEEEVTAVETPESRVLPPVRPLPPSPPATPPPPPPSTAPPPPPATVSTAPPPTKPKFTPTAARPEHVSESEEALVTAAEIEVEGMEEPLRGAEPAEAAPEPPEAEEAVPRVPPEDIGMESEEVPWVAEVRSALAEDRRLRAEEERREKGFLERSLTAEEWQAFADIPGDIDRLYRRVADKVTESPAVADYCLENLRLARVGYLKGEVGTVAEAEYRVERVRAKLERMEKSDEATTRPKMYLLLAWQFILLFIFGAMVVSTRTAIFLGVILPQLSEALYVDPAAARAMAALGWGGVGGVVGSLYNLPWFVQFREYDPGYNMSYVVGPIKGALLGGIIFLIFGAGLLAATAATATPSTLESNNAMTYLVYLAACLGGYKQEYVYERMDRLLRAIFGALPLPKELEVEESEGLGAEG
jgi:hypothetical protein